MSTKKSTENTATGRNLLPATANHIVTMLADIKALPDNTISNSLTPSERSRASSVGMARAGFVRKVVELWRINQQFAPGYFSTTEIIRLNEEFDSYTRIVTTAQELVDLAVDARIVSSEELFRFSLSFYDNVQQAATVSRVPEAQAIYRTLRPFFRAQGRRTKSTGEPTDEAEML